MTLTGSPTRKAKRSSVPGYYKTLVKKEARDHQSQTMKRYLDKIGVDFEKAAEEEQKRAKTPEGIRR